MIDFRSLPLGELESVIFKGKGLLDLAIRTVRLAMCSHKKALVMDAATYTTRRMVYATKHT